MSKYWRRTLNPEDDNDRAIMRKIVKLADIDRGGFAIFNYLPLSDVDIDNAGSHSRCRCPLGVEIHSPFGWNEIQKTAKHFFDGNSVCFEAWA